MMHLFESVTEFLFGTANQVLYWVFFLMFVGASAVLLVYALGPVLGIICTILFIAYLRR